MEVYFDNAATTRVLDSVRDIVVKTMTEDYANPAARHKKGMAAEQYIRQARSQIAGTLKAGEREIVFTSGGSEANNMALIGTALANRRRGQHIISTAVEHPSVYNPLAYLEEQGFAVTFLPVDREGHISMADLKAAIRPDTILLSVMYVNNEIGAVEPVEAISRLARAENPGILVHVDAIQAYGKYQIRPKQQGIDLLSASGHKFHGPKGVGFLYIGRGIKVKPLIYGGGQQWNLRSGTENVPGVAGLGAAAAEMYNGLEQKVSRLVLLKDYLIDRLEKIEGTTLNSRRGLESAPQIVSASFAGVLAEVLLHALAERGIYVSSGSACSTHHPGVSTTLKGIGLNPPLLNQTLRFSFGLFNTREEIDYCIGVLQELLPVLRRYQRG